jgi:HK97 family phage portal protein
VKIPIPFTKGKIIDLSLKSQSTFYPLNQSTSELLGFDLGDLTSNQSEQKLIDKGYGQNVTVYAIIKKIAQSGADIPKVLIDENNPDEIIEDGEVFDMLQQPAMLQGEVISQFDYFEALITYLLSSGNTYQRGLQATGFGDIWQKMEILPSGLTVPVVGNSFLSPVAGYQFNDKKRDLKFSKDDIIHTKFVNPTKLGLNTLEGLSPLQAAIYALTGSTDIQKAIAIMVKNQGVKGLVSSDSDRVMTPDAAKIMQEKFDKDMLGVGNFAKTKITSASVKYTQMGMSATDLKVIESGVLTDRQLCNAYSAPSVLFNDPANSTYNNYTTALKSLYTDAVIPVNNKILADINKDWLSMWSIRDNKRYKWMLDTSSIEALQADQKEEADKDNVIMDGVTKILALPITQDGKIFLLMDSYGYSEESAKKITEPFNTITE